MVFRVLGGLIALLMSLAVASSQESNTLSSEILTTTPPVSNSLNAETIQPAELKIANRQVVILRSTLLGEHPAARVKRAERLIRDVLDEGGNLTVSLAPMGNSYLVLIGGQRAFIITTDDLAPDEDSVRQSAENAAENLRQVIIDTEQMRSARYLLKALAYGIVASTLLILAIRSLLSAKAWLLSHLLPLMRQHSNRLKIGQTSLLDLGLLFQLLRRALSVLTWSLILLCLYTWLSYVLQQFPYTRPWGEGLNHYLISLFGYIVSAIVASLPGMSIVLVICILARGVIGLLRTLMLRLAAPGTMRWLTPETLPPTNRLMSLAIWLFALAMAYPYLPGAGTEAFKGLSVLVGLMVSLGASNVIGQAAAGLILTYSGTVRVGEFVRIGEHEGTVTEVGIFNTRIRTGLGIIMTLPNTLITGSVTKNYSRIIQGTGYLLDTKVTIGYDTPWRQVEALLLEACLRTEGIQTNPAPQVFQTALSDYYPEYHLVAHAIPREPQSRASLLSVLHANIQDLFNEYGVQIMSPHYIADPSEAKLVAKSQWYAAPAKPAPDETSKQN